MCLPDLVSGLQHDLDAVVLFLVEDVVAVRRFIQRQPVRDDEAGVDLSLLDSLQQRLHVALDVALPGLHRQRAVHERAHREFVYESAVDADDRDRTAVAASHDRLAQGDGSVRLRH